MFPKIFRNEAALWECLRPAQRSCGPCGSPVFESAICSDVNDVSATLFIFAILIVLFSYLIQTMPEPFSRKAGIRPVIQSSSATAWRRMSSIAPLKVKTSNLGAFNSIIGSIPRHHHNNAPCGSTSSSHLADGSVCLEFCRPAKISLFLWRIKQNIRNGTFMAHFPPYLPISFKLQT